MKVGLDCFGGIVWSKRYYYKLWHFIFYLKTFSYKMGNIEIGFEFVFDELPTLNPNWLSALATIITALTTQRVSHCLNNFNVVWPLASPPTSFDAVQCSLKVG